MVKEQTPRTVRQWLASVPVERKEAINTVRSVVNEHLPAGYEETVDWGMLAWVVPLSTLPNTHNAKPLLFAALGAHTKVMTLYLSFVFGNAERTREFETAYKKTGKKLDMGESCVHFKKLEDLPLDVVGDTIAGVSIGEYVEQYKSSRAKTKKPSTKKPAVKKAKTKKPTAKKSTRA